MQKLKLTVLFALLAAITLVLQAGCVSRQNSTAENTNLPAQEQSDDVWFAFDDDSLHLIGYKDKDGTKSINCETSAIIYEAVGGN
jgi:hypothetical protein